MRLLGEKQNGITSYYIYDNGYNPLARIEGTPGEEKISYFHNNLVGLPEQLTDSQGNSIWQAEYKIWGNAEKEWKDSRSNFDQNLRYQGQYLDRETGLHYNTFRYYDPDIGRFTQPDPIGLLGGRNLYQYAPSPVNWIDPFGLSGRICHETKIQEARTARDELAAEVANSRNRPATVTGGYNRKTGEVAARGCRGGKCAEDRVVEALGGNKDDVVFTEAVRPRNQQPPYRQVPVCKRCEGTYGREPFPKDTTIFQSDLE